MASSNSYSGLTPFDAQGRVRTVIDTPRGSRAKYKLDPETGLFQLSKLLPRGAVFPGNFGFVPGTCGEDGDPVDMLVLGDEPLELGCMLGVRVIGVLGAVQSEGNGRDVRNDRLLGVIETDFNPAEVGDINQLHPRILDEIEHFFVAYNQAQGRTFRPDGRGGADVALARIRDSAA